VWDWDLGSDDDFMGQVQIKISSFVDNFVEPSAFELQAKDNKTKNLFDEEPFGTIEMQVFVIKNN